MNVSWLSDIHMNFIKKRHKWERIAARLWGDNEAMLITGDIAEADTFEESIRVFAAVGGDRPLWFVLGNHDFYGSSIASVHRAAYRLSAELDNVTWLQSSGPIAISHEVALVGVDGWGDCRNGDVFKSCVEMSDWYLIEDFMHLTQFEQEISQTTLASIALLCESLGLNAAKLLAHKLSVLRHQERRRIVIATHVPPYKEMALDRNGLYPQPSAYPTYSCAQLGEVIDAFAMARPDIQVDVFSGHTHSKFEGTNAAGVGMNTQKCQYGHPSGTTISF